MLNNRNEETTSKINCTIIYDDRVIQPRKTTIEYQLNPNKQPQSITQLQTISITLEENDQTVMEKMFGGEKNRTVSSSTTTSIHSTSSSAAIAIISSNLKYQTKLNSPTLAVGSSNLGGVGGGGDPSINVFNGVDNVWTKRNLENSVTIPENLQKIIPTSLIYFFVYLLRTQIK